MRVEVEPRRATVAPGRPTILTVRVVNTGTVISGHRVRILGVDPKWVHLDLDQLSLFPDAAGVAVLSITLPPGIPAGLRHVGVEVQELTPPGDRQVIEVELTVPAELGLKVELDPASVAGGRGTSVGVLVDNTGNSDVDIDLTGSDEEAQVTFLFKPAMATLAPGERTLATVALRAKRPLFGSPKVRSFKIHVGPAQPPVSAFGTWVQKPLLSRGAIALIGLVVAISVFALVLTLSLGKVVGNSNADRDLALQVAQANQAGSAGGGSGSIKGTVTLLTSGMGVSGVTVEIFNASNTASPLASTATIATGGYQFQGLGPGTYKIRFSGAGFTQLWYPASLTADNAMPIALTAGQPPLTGIDVRLGGVPASLTGLVVGADPTGAMVALEVPAPSGTTAQVSGSPATGQTQSASATPATVTTQTLDASGAFTLTQIPSPSIYDLVVSKQGFSTVTQEVDLGSGEQRKGLVITLRQGDGSITGQVNTATGPLGGATISASDGHTTASTVSLTQGTVGSFTLTNLPTPDTFTVIVSAPGFATQTVTVTLAAAQQLTGVSVTLATGSGSISGQASLTNGAPADGVNVTVTNGQLSLQTVTLSTGKAGSYQVTGLPVPSTYTVTFARPDLASQTKAVTLDNLGTAAATGVDVTMTSASAILSGVVLESPCAPTPTTPPTTSPPTTSPPTTPPTATPTTTPPTTPSTTMAPTSTSGFAVKMAATQCPVGGVTVTLSSGTTSYQVTSASTTSASPGAYEFDNVQPGTYTVSFTRPGGEPTSSILTLAAGSQKTLSPLLAPAASIFGTVYQAATGSTPITPAAGVEVRLFVATQYPSGTPRTVLTDGGGNFLFNNVDAPQSYVVEFRFPPGSPGQFTVGATLTLSQQDEICHPSTQNCQVSVG
jgi:hypothetical protein